MAKREKGTGSTLLVVAAAIGIAVWLKRRKKSSIVPAVTPGTGDGTHNVAVDADGNPSPGPGYYLDYGPDGQRHWMPVGAMN